MTEHGCPKEIAASVQAGAIDVFHADSLAGPMKNLASKRTVDFIRNVATLEGKPELAQGIIDKAAVDPNKPPTGSADDCRCGVVVGQSRRGEVHSGGRRPS